MCEGGSQISRKVRVHSETFLHWFLSLQARIQEGRGANPTKLVRPQETHSNLCAKVCCEKNVGSRAPPLGIAAGNCMGMRSMLFTLLYLTFLHSWFCSSSDDKQRKKKHSRHKRVGSFRVSVFFSCVWVCFLFGTRNASKYTWLATRWCCRVWEWNRTRNLTRTVNRVKWSHRNNCGIRN